MGYEYFTQKQRSKTANALDPEVAEAISRIYQTELNGYNFCHATDVLAEDKGYLSLSALSHDTLRLMVFDLQSPSADPRNIVQERHVNVRGNGSNGRFQLRLVE